MPDDRTPDPSGPRPDGPRGRSGAGRARTPGLPVLLTGVTVTYGELTALCGVDLRADGGALTAVTGHSGAGKSTLLGVIAGTVPSTTGEVLLGGSPLARDGAVSGAVSTVPQGNALVGIFTAYENVLVALVTRGVPEADAVHRASEALAAVGLGDAGGHLVDELSGGQQQRVAVARALAQGSPVLLADEPTSELDHVTRERVLDLLVERAQAGGTVVMTTHDPEAAARADAVWELDDGEITRVR